MGRITEEAADTLRGLASGRRSVVEGLLRLNVEGIEASGLDERTHALVSIAAMIAGGASASEYPTHVGSAIAAGCTGDEIVGVIVAIAPITGTSRVVTAAPALLRSLGLDPGPHPPRHGEPQ